MVKINKNKDKFGNKNSPKPVGNLGPRPLLSSGKIPIAEVLDTVIFKNYEALHSLASPIPTNNIISTNNPVPTNNFPCIFDYGWQKPKPYFTAGLSHHHLCSLKN